MPEIVIEQNDGWVQYTATGGETSFAYDFPIFDEAHLVVIVTDDNGDDTTLTITTDYTVTDVGDAAGGDVELIEAATADYIYTIYRDVPEERQTDYQQAGDFDAATINRELDLQTMMMQQLRRDIDRAVALSKSSSASISPELPDPQADYLIGWKSDLSGLENKADIGTQTVAGYMATLLQSSSEAAFKAAANLEAGTDFQAFNALLADIAGLSLAQGEILYFNGSDIVALGVGTAGKFLKTQGAAANPVWASLTLGWSFVSAAQTPSVGSSISVAHGLGAEPSDVLLVLECTTAELGYSIGDRIFLGSYVASSSNRGIVIEVTATNVIVHTGATAGFTILNKSTYAVADITPGSWSLYIQARL